MYSKYHKAGAITSRDTFNSKQKRLLVVIMQQLRQTVSIMHWKLRV